jgi:hypothetical protein
VTLTGKHWPASSKIRLKDCGGRGWVVTQKHQCNKGKIVVHTTKRGRFTTSVPMALCPHTSDWPGHPVTERRCYVGQPMPSGVDTITLVGHVKIIVTYP